MKITIDKYIPDLNNTAVADAIDKSGMEDSLLENIPAQDIIDPHLRKLWYEGQNALTAIYEYLEI